MNPIVDLAYQINNLTNFFSTNITQIGTNDGRDLDTLSKMLSSNHKGTKLYGYEPNLYWVNKTISNPNLSIIPKAIGNFTGVKDFNLVTDEHRNCSSFLTRVDNWSLALKHTSVLCEMIKGCNIPTPDILIIDAEGMSYEILKSFEGKLNSISVIMLESEHCELFTGQKLFNDIQEYLILQGFIMSYFAFQYKNQSNSIWIRNDILLR